MYVIVLRRQLAIGGPYIVEKSSPNQIFERCLSWMKRKTVRISTVRSLWSSSFYALIDICRPETSKSLRRLHLGPRIFPWQHEDTLHCTVTISRHWRMQRTALSNWFSCYSIYFDLHKRLFMYNYLSFVGDKIMVFRVTTPCTCSGCFLRNVCICQPNCTGSHSLKTVAVVCLIFA